jgi:hypothetical protein
MTDDLVKRLRSQFSIDQVRDNPTFVASTYEEERDEAADRIEQLEAALHKFRSIPQGKYTVYIKDDSTVAWKSEGAFSFFDGDRKYTIAWEKRDG